MNWNRKTNLSKILQLVKKANIVDSAIISMCVILFEKHLSFFSSILGFKFMLKKKKQNAP